MKILKWLLWIVVAVLVLAIGLGTYLALTFDPNEYKPELIKLVKERTGRTLSIDGDIELKFFPKIGAGVEGVALSVPNGDARFAQVQEARVALALLPLLSKQIIVDEVTLTGLRAELVKYRDGSTNFDDLLGGGKPPKQKDEPQKTEPAAKQPMAIDIGGIALQDADVTWRDEASGMQLRAADVNLNTGRIASGVPGQMRFSARIEGKEPELALQIELSAGYRLDMETGGAQLSNVDLKAEGDAAALRALRLHVKGDTAGWNPQTALIDLNGIEASAKSGDMLDAQFSIPKLHISADRSESKPINGRLQYRTPELEVAADLALAALQTEGEQVRFSRVEADMKVKQHELGIDGKVATPVLLDLGAKRLQLPQIAGDFVFSGPDVPNKSAKLRLEGAKTLDWGAESAKADLIAKLEDGTVNLRAAIKGFDKPAVDFDLQADRLDVDRYLPPGKETGAKGGASKPAATPGASAGGATEEAPIDLAWLKPLQAKGSIQVGELVVSRIHAQDVDIRINADKGKLSVDPMSARLYQGSLQGSTQIDANRNSYVVKQRLVGINIGPLLRDAVQKDILEGRGTVQLDLRTVGTTATGLKRGLNGTASVVLKDGAVKGINLAAALRKAKAMLGSKSAAEEQAQGGEQTDFSDMSASFRIDKGVAHNKDLLLRSPFLRVQGAGDIDLVAASMDYDVKASLVNTSTGQSGKKLDEVASLTVPVAISGPLENLSYRLDTRALVTDQAKDALREQLQRRLGGNDKEEQATEGATGKTDKPAAEEKPRGKIGEQLLRGLLK